MNNIEAIKLEEDMFPKVFTNFRETDFGILFYNEENKKSYDSNHAVIYKERIDDLGEVLDYISEFYRRKGIHQSIYQAMEDELYFSQNEKVFNEHGYEIWTEGPAKFMALLEVNNIDMERSLEIKLISEWDERIARDICIPSDEVHEIEVIKSYLKMENSRVFVGYLDDKAVAITYFHISEYGCIRFDYIIISKEYRKNGYGRALLSYVTDYCRDNNMKNCYQWPAHKTSEKICYEAGFRHIFEAEIGRASYKEKQ